VGGVIVALIAMLFHPAGPNANDLPVVFTQTAHSSGYTADHLLQFIGEAIGVAGLLVLFSALNLTNGMPRLAARIGVVLSGVALGLIALRSAVDGVVLKRAADAWVNAPDAEKAVRFASAETVRWLEEAITSYQGYVLGAALILLGALIVWVARAPRPVGYLLALGGVGYLAASWMVGVSGFGAPGRTIPSYAAVFSPPIAGVWLLIATWRRPGGK